MKKQIVWIWLPLIGLWFGACNNDDDATPPAPVPRITVTTDVDGTLEGTAEAVIFDEDGNGSLETVIYFQSNSGRETALMSLPLDRVGNLVLENNGFFPPISYYSNMVNYSFESGNVEFTQFDTERNLLSGRLDAQLEATDASGRSTSISIVMENVDLRRPRQDGSLSAEIDGSLVTFTETTSYRFGQVFFSGMMGGNMLSITFDRNVAEAQYQFSWDDFSPAVSASYIESDDFFFPTDATVNITKHDRNARLIEGTMNGSFADFQQTQSRLIRNCRFSFHY